VLDPEFRRALGYIRPYWRPLLVVLLLSTAGTALSLFLPFLSRALVDDALLARNTQALFRIVGYFSLITLVSFGLNVASGLRYTRVSAEILFDMRLTLYRHLQQLSPRFYAHMPLGQIVSRLNNDISEIQRVAAETILAWVTSLLFLIGTIIMLIRLDLRLFLVAMALLPPAIWALVRFRGQLELAVAALRERSAEVGTFLIDTLQGMRLVVTQNAQELEATRFRERNDAFIGALMRMQRLTYFAGGVPGLLLSIGTTGVFLYGGWRVIEQTLTLGTFVAFIAYQMRLLSPIQGLMGLYTGLATARVSLRRVHQILDAPIEVREAPDAIDLPIVRGDIAFQNVSLSFDRGAPALDRVSFEVRSGETLALVGPSGSGKSTIADLVVRLLDPQEGRVMLDGHDLRGIRLRDVRAHVSRVDQEPFVFNTSLLENIRYAQPEASDARVAAAVDAAGLSAFVAGLPRGLATVVGERGHALSAGERQRLAIARAFLANPRILVLDEATASLDPVTEAHVIAGYEAIMKGRTTILISHRLELARTADRAVVLIGGRIIEEGEPQQLLAMGGAFAQLFASSQTAAV
jgi:ATP-binding cassette, subfamily B, bacterial